MRGVARQCLGWGPQASLDAQGPRLLASSPAIDKGLQIGITDRNFGHDFLRLWVCDFPSPMISRRRCRPRDNRDMTVPMGIPTIFATS